MLHPTEESSPKIAAVRGEMLGWRGPLDWFGIWPGDRSTD
jgi:hypothetical protein